MNKCDGVCVFTNSLGLVVEISDIKLLIIAVNRTPSGNLTDFLDSLEYNLQRLKDSNSCVFVGDLNNNVTNEYIHISIKYG